ncbi:hypothetical protein LCGC14_1919610 [marine sediment metagenome]|uniref:Zinc-ribbon domain-containing protein n=1 Tax=marine sediment metagenome TaxID=412755 RepID=A0A0F9I567_9ZZZZ
MEAYVIKNKKEEGYFRDRLYRNVPLNGARLFTTEDEAKRYSYDMLEDIGGETVRVEILLTSEIGRPRLVTKKHLYCVRSTYSCPYCDEAVLERESRYCPRCGMALEWSSSI